VAGGLAVVFPAWMKYVRAHDPDRFAQFAVRVWGVEENFRDRDATGLAGIGRLEGFWQAIGLATRLSGLGIDDARIDEMASKATGGDKSTVGNFVKLGQKEISEILGIALV
jgi:alcohol dehydrogenase YqhD (iron-dependent ADH family)